MTSAVNRSWRWTVGRLLALFAAAALVNPATGPQASAQVQPARPAGNAPPAAARSVVKLYPVPADRRQDIVSQLQEQFANQPAVNIGADERTGSVVVVGPVAAQLEVGRQIDAALAAPPNPVPAVAAADAADRDPVRIVRVAHTLRNISSQDAEHSMADIWGNTATFAASRGGEQTTVRVPVGDQGAALLGIDHRRGIVSIDAPEHEIASWRRVVQTIDAPRGAASAQVGIMPFDRADPSKIQRAIELIRQATRGLAGPLRELSAGGSRPRRQHIGQFVSMIFQPEGQPAGGQPDGGGQAQPGDGDAGAAVGGEGAAGGVAEALGRIGNVQIEFVQGLDILIIRGNRRDVDLVKEIIRQIEELSIQTQPEVEIYYLQNVDGVQMTELINQIYSTAFVSQSPVTLTPLVKPNALLVIGRKEAIGPVIELIRRLDQPVSPQTQFRVFPLRFLPAVDAERTVRTFFTTRPGQDAALRTGLGTRVLAIADFRSNSLIVQASPRDLEEIARLLAEIDVEGTDDQGATNEVRVFKLKNSLADDLVLVLQEAVSGQVQGQQQQPQQQQQQQGGQGVGTPTPQSSAQRETRLQMLSLDQEGRRIINSGILSDLRVSSDPRSNSLVVVGPPSTMPLISELIRQLDAPPGAEAQVKVFKIENGDAAQLSTMLQNVFGSQTTQAGGGGLGAAGFQSLAGTGESPLVPLRFAVDTRTNSIIATGSAGDLRVVYNILVRMDEAGVREREIKVYRLKNTFATAVATALNNFLQNQQNLQTTQGQVSAQELLEQRVIIVDDPVTNSLIVSAAKSYYSQIERVIEDLDKRNPMVVIQLLIAEVTLSDLDELGAEFGLQDALLFQRGIPTPGFAFNNSPLGNVTTGVNTENTAGQGLTNFGVGRSSAAGGVAGLVLSASSESVSVLIRALQSSQRVQILSRPQIQTMDQQPAFVQVGARVPRVGGTTLAGTGASQSTVEDVNVGIILGVTPRVTPDGMVVMEIDAEKSEVGPASTAIPVGFSPDGTPILSPQILTNLAQTTITARSGQTVILGGLISRTEGQQTRRVPYLGDVPVLGRLFRFDSTSIERRELILFLTPYIMESPEIEAEFNFRETERMSWCLADVVNVHGALPAGTAGGNVQSPQSPLIFPAETPAGPSIMMPPQGDQRLPPLPPQTPLSPVDLPQSSRRPLQPVEGRQAALPLPSWQPSAAVPQEVQPAMQWEEADPRAPQNQDAGTPHIPAIPPTGGLTPATIAPAGYQRPAAPSYPQLPQGSIYDP